MKKLTKTEMTKWVDDNINLFDDSITIEDYECAVIENAYNDIPGEQIADLSKLAFEMINGLS